MEMQVVYFTSEKAIKLHDWVIQNSGGSMGSYPNIE